MVSQEIIVYSDYVCPFCLLAEEVIAQATEGLDVEVRWRPFELRPAPVPTLKVEDPYLPRVWRESVYPMAEKLGVPIKLPTISPQPRTDKAFEVFAMAEEQGAGHAYSMATLKAFFQQERDIGDPNVLADIGEAVGLAHQAVLDALADGRYREQHQAALRHAVEEAHIQSVPTLIIGGETVQGVPDPLALRRFLTERA
ncbi:DsbA family oxidoreductase [Halomonas sp. HL-93]|uniref:DsbA family oxidoreductase n=1 Tax=Halomonas sp. HL-93 TaxID=1666906 RepID=UPI0006DA88B1|nr:DsbA family protein [Halomonas sp. HL-93]KPQ21258.1 MAG: putative dithiol-disulfide isomerase involved in polyketide biosynthesis [Halomonas sp. HL-93]SBR50896.1 Predicted dithiol-disulfide isomerase, DsbA family [Halomonas sp. HL-93]